MLANTNTEKKKHKKDRQQEGRNTKQHKYHKYKTTAQERTDNKKKE